MRTQGNGGVKFGWCVDIDGERNLDTIAPFLKDCS